MILEHTSGEEWRIVALPYTKYFGHYRLEALPVIDSISWPTAKGNAGAPRVMNPRVSPTDDCTVGQ